MDRVEMKKLPKRTTVFHLPGQQLIRQKDVEGVKAENERLGVTDIEILKVDRKTLIHNNKKKNHHIST